MRTRSIFRRIQARQIKVRRLCRSCVYKRIWPEEPLPQQNQNDPAQTGSFFDIALLGLLDVGRARALFRLFGLEGNLVAFVEVGEGDFDQARAVEEDILVAAVRGDEPKTFFGVKTLDDTGHILIFYE